MPKPSKRAAWRILVLALTLSVATSLTTSAIEAASNTAPSTPFKLVFAARKRDAQGVPTGMQLLFTADGDGSHLTQFTPLGEDVFYDWPVWVLNGTRVLFTVRTTLEDLGQEAVYMAKPDGTELVNLFASDWPLGQPKLSADGQSLLFTGSWPQFRGTAVYQLSLKSGLVQNITAATPKAVHDSDARWSADGQSIIFTGLGDDVNGERPSQIMFVGLQGQQRQRITHDTWHNVDPMLSPDERYVAFSSYRGPGSPADLAAGQVIGLNTDLRSLRVHLNDWQLIVQDLATGEQRSLTQGKNCPDQSWSEPCQPTEGPAWVPVWLPDGKHIAFLSARSELDSGIYSVGLDGKEARTLFESRNLVPDWFDWALVGGDPNTPGPSSPPKPAQNLLWGGVVHELDPTTGADSPTDELFVTTPDLWTGHQVIPTDANGAQLSVHSARWSPDRTQILFTSPVSLADGSQLDQVFLMNADGSQVRQLTTPTTEDPLQPLDDGDLRANTEPDMSPDGRFVMFSSKAATNDSSLLRLDLLTGDVLNLTTLTSGHVDGPDLSGRYAPDGQTIALTSVSDSAQIALLSSQGQDFRLVTNDEFDNTDPAWSPDGRWLAYIRHARPPVADDGTSLPEDPSSEVDVMKVNVETGEQVVLGRTTGQFSNVAWSPDQRQVVCVGLPAYDQLDNFVQPDIYQVSATGGTLTPLAVTLTTAEAFVDWR